MDRQGVELGSGAARAGSGSSDVQLCKMARCGILSWFPLRCFLEENIPGEVRVSMVYSKSSSLSMYSYYDIAYDRLGCISIPDSHSNNCTTMRLKYGGYKVYPRHIPASSLRLLAHGKYNLSLAKAHLSSVSGDGLHEANLRKAQYYSSTLFGV